MKDKQITVIAVFSFVFCIYSCSLNVLTTNVIKLVKHDILYTVKPFMFPCPLYREFCEHNKTLKLKVVNIDTVPTLIGITHVLELCGLKSPK